MKVRIGGLLMFGFSILFFGFTPPDQASDAPGKLLNLTNLVPVTMKFQGGNARRSLSGRQIRRTFTRFLTEAQLFTSNMDFSRSWGRIIRGLKEQKLK